MAIVTAGGRARATLFLAACVVGAVAMMIVPLPTALVDILVSANLAVAVAVVLAALLAPSTKELATFPSLLVLTTLFRLALNVSTVRLILLQADAGRVIHSFGAFVVRGDYIVGAAVFVILTIVQYMVIARGAERVAEVAARFTLDALPGRQLAIDADVRSGTMDAEGARRARRDLQREAQMYGALDGAMRFVRGDAVAGILILGVSMIGGLLIGVVQRGMAVGDAARIYTLLTIGDGLVTQLPALLMATAAGLVVTRVGGGEDSAEGSLAAELAEMLLRPRALAMASVTLALLSLVPGLPLWPFATVATVIGGTALWIARRPAAAVATAAWPRPVAQLEVAVSPELLAELGGLRLEEVANVVANDLGLVVPAVGLRGDALLPRRTYEVRLRGVPFGGGLIPEGKWLASTAPAKLPVGVDAEPGEDPTTGALAAWVDSGAATELGRQGITVRDAPACVAARFEAVLRLAAAELLGLDETQRLLDELARAQPSLVRELVPRRMEVGALADVLRRLVGEDVPVTDLRAILEALSRIEDVRAMDRALVVEHVRVALRRQISRRFAPEGTLDALMLDADAEEAVRGALRATSKSGVQLAIEPDLAAMLLASLTRALETRRRGVVLTTSELRRHVRRLVEGDHPQVTVLSYDELLPQIEVTTAATLTVA